VTSALNPAVMPLLLLALACVHPVPAPPRPDPPAIMRERVVPVKPRAEPCRIPALPPPPEEPEIDWMHHGCPPIFGACLDGADAERMRIWMHGIGEWTRMVKSRCSDGGR